MKPYELKRNTHFVMEYGDTRSNEVFLFDHIDGAYSLCYHKDNNIVHFSAGIPVRAYENI